MPRSRSATAQPDLATRIRASRVMTAELKKYWLGVLPYLSDPERAKLEALLEGEPPLPRPPRTAPRRTGTVPEP